MKANKKRFTDGLDILFNDPEDQVFSQDSALLSEKEQNQPSFSRGDIYTQVEKKHTNKNFTSDLDALLNSALQESINEMQQQAQEQQKSQPGARFSAPQPRMNMPTGLDAIIRQTLHASQSISVNDTFNTVDSPAGRIVFTFDKKKLEKLKTIAHIEQTFVKDIIKKVIADYINTYEQQKGAVI
jgi:hypothetical protein